MKVSTYKYIRFKKTKRRSNIHATQAPRGGRKSGKSNC